MAASKLDLDIEQGATFTLTVTLTHPNGLPIDLTGFTGKSQIRKVHGDSLVLADFDVTITDPTKGIILMQLTNVQTLALNFVSGVYDLILLSAGPVVSRILEGNVRLKPEVTEY